MAIPSRVFVGMVVFGLIACLAIVPYTLLVVSGEKPDLVAPFLPEQPPSLGDKATLVLASVFSIALTVFAWRGLLSGARMNARLRREQAARKLQPPPPGYQ